MPDGSLPIPPAFPRARVPSLARRVRDAVRGATAAGVEIRQVRISPEGAVTLLTGPPPAAEPDAGANEWDEVLGR